MGAYSCPCPSIVLGQISVAYEHRPNKGSLAWFYIICMPPPKTHSFYARAAACWPIVHTARAARPSAAAAAPAAASAAGPVPAVTGGAASAAGPTAAAAAAAAAAAGPRCHVRWCASATARVRCAAAAAAAAAAATAHHPGHVGKFYTGVAKWVDWWVCSSLPASDDSKTFQDKLRSMSLTAKLLIENAVNHVEVMVKCKVLNSKKELCMSALKGMAVRMQLGGQHVGVVCTCLRTCMSMHPCCLSPSTFDFACALCWPVCLSLEACIICAWLLVQAAALIACLAAGLCAGRSASAFCERVERVLTSQHALPCQPAVVQSCGF